MRVHRWFLSAVFGMGVLGCDDRAPLAADEFAERYLRASTEISSRCVIRPVLPGSFLDRPGGAEVAGEVSALIAEGRLRYDAAAAAECLAEIEGRECEPSDAVGVPWLPEPCTRALRGALTDGAACESGPECASGVCTASEALCPGRCVARQPEGAPCASLVECEEGLTCEAERCARGSPLGSACTSVLPFQASCDRGLVCVDLSSETEGACVVPAFTAGEGEPCGESDGVLCRADLVCALAGPAANRCERRYERDAECRASFPEGCPEGQICAPAESGERCTDLPREGEPCLFAGSTFPRCTPGLRCIDDGADERCRSVRPVGASCSRASECASGLCEGGVCSAIALSCVR